MKNETEKYILNAIKEEIETKHDCKVISIEFAQLLSLCVRFRVIFNESFLYKPFENLPVPDYIDMNEKYMVFVRRVDLFESIKKLKNLN